MFKVLNWHINERIGYLEINNPPSNPMDSLFFEEFYWWRTEIVENADIDSVIMHGKGRHFSSGAVLNDLLGIINTSYEHGKDIKKISEFLNKNSQIFYSLKELKIPVIAAVRGVCIGSAFELALCADYIVCGEKAVLGLPETSFDIMPGCTGTYVLPKVAGKALAMELILTGKTFFPDEALELKLIQKVVPTKQVLDSATNIAKSLALRFIEDLKFI
jgi:enoyl-CoA hydratase/carnithine racemase